MRQQYYLKDDSVDDDPEGPRNFPWACSFTAKKKSYVWDPELHYRPGWTMSHYLVIKTAIMKPSVKEGEVNIIQVEVEGFNKKKVVTPLVAMKAGKDFQTRIDIQFSPSNGEPYPVHRKVKLKLIQGEGPISLVGTHTVDYVRHYIE